MSSARHFVCTWCDGLVELAAPVQAEESVVAIWCARCREITPAFVAGGRKASCSRHLPGMGHPAFPLGAPLDDADN